MKMSLTFAGVLITLLIGAAIHDSRAGILRGKAIKLIEHRQLVEEPTTSEHQKQLTHYVLDALHNWAPASTIVGTHNTSHFDSIATDIVNVVLEPGEAPLWPEDVDKSRTAILLSTIEHFEGHAWPYVEDGTCNSKNRDNPLLKNGGCDGGEAYSLWQIHPERGIMLLDNGLWGHALNINDQRIVTGAKLLQDRRLAARTALHMIRASFKNQHQTLCEYTGEKFKGNHPKADQRLMFAKKWWETHPFLGQN